jgi:hypothetical protein
MVDFLPSAVLACVLALRTETSLHTWVGFCAGLSGLGGVQMPVSFCLVVQESLAGMHLVFHMIVFSTGEFLWGALWEAVQVWTENKQTNKPLGWEGHKMEQVWVCVLAPATDLCF